MLFHTLHFLAFLCVLAAILCLFKKNQHRKLILLVGSYFFYMCWNPAFILLIVLSTIIDFFVGKWLDQAEGVRTRRMLLTISIVANLGVLGFFKYANFFRDSVLFVETLFGYEASWTSLNIVLPVGVSYYTFQTMSYTIDVYRRNLPSCRSSIDFALYVSFFPQLVAGPIVRAIDFLPQLKNDIHLRFERTDFFLVVRGLVKKVLVADNLAPFVEEVFESPSTWPSAIIWMATLCFSVQIYCDFSGYSDMAIGIARMLGFQLPRNFDRPYFATNPPDFWRKWHISLSSWLRDYLYVPLGGNRGGSAYTNRNLMLTMLLGGLWHGASWNFVLWGGLHGLVLIFHRSFRSYVDNAKRPGEFFNSRLWALISFLGMQVFILVTWIPFRIVETGPMLDALQKFVFFDFNYHLADIGAGGVAFFSTLFILVGFLFMHVYSWVWGGMDEKLSRAPLWLSSVLCILIGILLVQFWPSKENPFIYYQF